MEVHHENLKYAAVEIISKGGPSGSIMGGLLRGITNVGSDDFVWTSGRNGVARAHNTKFFSILMLTTFDGTSKMYSIFEDSDKEQKLAKDLIKETVERFPLTILSGDTQLLDCSKFEDVPEGLKDWKGIPTAVDKSSTFDKKNAEWDKRNSASKTTTSYYAEAEPFFFKRKTRKPTKKALEKLRSKLDLIIGREYEYQPPVIDSETENEDDNTSNVDRSIGSFNY